MFNLANKLLNKCNHSCLGSKCTLKKYLPYKCSVSSIIAKEIKLILKYLVMTLYELILRIGLKKSTDTILIFKLNPLP